MFAYSVANKVLRSDPRLSMPHECVSRPPLSQGLSGNLSAALNLKFGNNRNHKAKLYSQIMDIGQVSHSSEVLKKHLHSLYIRNNIIIRTDTRQNSNSYPFLFAMKLF